MARKRRVTRRKREIPVLTDAVAGAAETARPGGDDELAELTERLTSRIHALVDELLHAANEQLSDLLRQELPALIESTLREAQADTSKSD